MKERENKDICRPSPKIYPVNLNDLSLNNVNT